MAENLKRLTVFFGADLSELKKGLKDAQQKIKRTFGKDTIDASNNLGVALAAVAVGVGAFAVKSVMANEALTREKRSFDALTGSADKTKILLKQLETAGKKGIFNDENLREYSKGLLSMGYSAGQVVPVILAASEAAAATGQGVEGLGKITEALGTMKARGEMTQRSMMTLISAGLPAWDILATKIGTTVPEAQERLKNGTLNSGKALEALINGMADKYKGTMDTMRDDLPTSYKRILDSFEDISRTAGAKITAALGLEKIFVKIAAAVEKFSDTLKTGGLQKALDGLIDPALQVAILAVGGAIMAGLIPGLVAAGLAAAAAMIPLLPWIAAGAAIAGLAYLIIRNWRPIKAFFIETFIGIEYYSKIALYALGDCFIWLANTALTSVEKMFSWVPGLSEKIAEAKAKVNELKEAIETAKSDNIDKAAAAMKKLKTEATDATVELDACDAAAPAPDKYVATAVAATNLTDDLKVLKDGTEALGNSFSDAFADIIMGTKTATESLKDLGSQMAKLFIKTGFQSMLSAISSAVTPGTDAGAAIAGHATGGYVAFPTISKLAEQEPEYIVPASKAESFSQKMGSGNGKLSIQNTVINNVSNTAQATTTTQQDGDKLIINTLINAISTNKGGLKTLIKGAARQ